MGLLDRLGAGVGKLGHAAGQAIDETRLQMEMMRARKRKDTAARDLGYLVFRVSQGALVTPGEQDALIKRIADAEQEVERLATEVKQLHAAGKSTPPAAEPPPKTEPPKGGPSAGASAEATAGTAGTAGAEPATPGADPAS